jgi:Fic family protein
MFDPKYTLTDRIVSMLTAIAEAKALIERAKILPKNEVQLRRQALIRMTHSSTEIEGNLLNLDQVAAIVANKKVDAPQRDIYEVKNYLNALKYIEEVVATKKPITEKVFLRIHRLVTDKTLPKERSGHYRQGPIYVVRRGLGLKDEVVYTGPAAKDVPQLSAALLAWLTQSERENVNPVIVAGIIHQEIAAIHPFADGNGRTARAMATLVLYQRGYDFRRLFALEDYYNRDRSAYYDAINIGKDYAERRTDFTPWLEYFVTGFQEEIDRVKAQITALAARKLTGTTATQLYLDKDQLTIIDFIDQVGRIAVSDVIDILNVPKRTAQLKLAQLKSLGVIIQQGKGPSSAYVLKK